MTEVRTTVTRYNVSAYPDPDSINAHHFTITVELRGNGRWGVCWMGRCLGKRGQWSWESNPSSRTDRWKNAYRRDLDTALRLAQKAAPLLRVNGSTPAECWAWEQDRTAELEAVDGG